MAGPFNGAMPQGPQTQPSQGIGAIMPQGGVAAATASPQNPQQFQDLHKGWMSFLGRPEVQNFLLAAGSNMLQVGSDVGSGLQAGMNAVAKSQEVQRKESGDTADEALAARKVATGEAEQKSKAQYEQTTGAAETSRAASYAKMAGAAQTRAGATGAGKSTPEDKLYNNVYQNTLKAMLAGTLLSPGDEGYDEAFMDASTKAADAAERALQAHALATGGKAPAQAGAPASAAGAAPAEAEAPTQASIDYLKVHPETAPLFEKRFGKGSSTKYSGKK